MADTLCGPSNALQSFQKHAQLDRTLQQDRFSSHRHSSTQGFRSHDPRLGALDAEFHAFENATTNPYQFSDPLFTQPRPDSARFQSASPFPAAGWAADFQRLQIADQPIPAHQFRMEAPLMKSMHGGWQNEFMRQRPDNLSSIAQGKQTSAYPSQTSTFSANNQLQYQGSNYMQPFVSEQNAMHYANHDGQLQQQAGDQSAAEGWSQAFDAAFQDAFDVAQQDSQIADLQADRNIHQESIRTDKLPEQAQSHLNHSVENTRIGSDAIQYTETTERTSERDMEDANALARVAGELLQNVHNDSNEKFQNSQFLNLMRKIRDREVEVKNNDFESTRTSTATDITAVDTNRAAPASVSDEVEHGALQKPQTEGFSFPDLNAVYEPSLADAVDYPFDAEPYSMPHRIPQSQVQDLHPGGRLYPGAPENERTEMSGGVGQISIDEFDTVDENRDFAVRFSRAPLGESSSSDA